MYLLQLDTPSTAFTVCLWTGIQCLTRHGLSKRRISKQKPHLIRDITANLMTEVCDGVNVESFLQPLSG